MCLQQAGWRLIDAPGSSAHVSGAAAIPSTPDAHACCRHRRKVPKAVLRGHIAARLESTLGGPKAVHVLPCASHIWEYCPDLESEATAPTGTDACLARRLREFRLERRWSLEELAARSGVSRATVSRTENQETAAVLGRLCAAFQLTMSRLLAQVEVDRPALVLRHAQPEWTDPETGYRRRSISPPSPDFECGLLQCELPAGAHLA